MLFRSGNATGRITARSAQPSTGSVTELRLPAHDLVVTATWASDPGLIRRILGVRSLTADVRVTPGRTRTGLASRAVGHAAAAVYTGPGFDACENPSLTELTAWLSSDYRAVGTYIGGTNMGCSQPNLNATYVASAVAQGWHLLPTDRKSVV